METEDQAALTALAGGGGGGNDPGGALSTCLAMPRCAWSSQMELTQNARTRLIGIPAGGPAAMTATLRSQNLHRITGIHLIVQDDSTCTSEPLFWSKNREINKLLTCVTEAMHAQWQHAFAYR